MDRKTLTGAVLAAAVGAMFLTSPVFAQDSSSGSSQASVKCVGGNSCKGQSSCKGGNHSCKGLERLQRPGLRQRPRPRRNVPTRAAIRRKRRTNRRLTDLGGSGTRAAPPPRCATASAGSSV